MSVITTFNVEKGESIIRVAETYVLIRGNLNIEGNLNISGNTNVDGNFTINERKVYSNDNVICVTNSAEYVLNQTNVYEKIGNLALWNQLGNKLSLSNDEIIIGSGISKIIVSYSLVYAGAGGKGTKYIRLMKNDTNTRLVAQGTLGTSGVENYRLIMHTTDFLLDVEEGDHIWLAVYGIAGDKVEYNANYLIFTVRAVA